MISDCITSAEAKTVRVDAFMPNATTSFEDDYVMTSAKLPDEEMYITKFLPRVDESKAHHMLIFLCNEPASPNKLWRGGTTLSMALLPFITEPFVSDCTDPHPNRYMRRWRQYARVRLCPWRQEVRHA